jgi:multiple sugar transport system substrate-binding protein
MFAEGEFAHLIGGTWIMPGWAQTHPDFTNYTAIHFPLVNADDFGGYFYTSGAGQFLAINPQTQHPQEAWEFYKFMHSETFGRNWAETGNGMTLATPGTAEDYAAFTPAWQNIFAMADLMRISPQPRVRNPDTASVEVTLVGPWEGQILLGALTGQIDDVQAALDDLDQRSMEALELGIADAQAAGLNVSLEDYMFPDWNPTENYTGN